MIIWIASYPKSGNTWVRAFLTAYYFTKDGVYDPKELKQIPDYPNAKIIGKNIKENTIHLYWKESQEKFTKDNKIIFLKTHNALLTIGKYPFTTPKLTRGVIYIVRDPRNVITSLKNHMDFTSYEEAFNFMTDKNIILTNKEKIFSRNQFISSWRINYSSWTKMNTFKKLLIRYEDMITKPERTFKQLILFTNMISNHENKINEEKFKNAILTTSFENMKKSEQKGEFNENVNSPLNNNKREFFYLGPNNDWKKLLDDKITNKMNQYYKNDLKLLRYEI
tara:strand:- start:540 stop:1376 length:837 start_codon:yes stop_codon:yes gene_type:complete